MSLGPEQLEPAPHTWQAKWCWTRTHLSRPWNVYLCFRRLIELPARPKHAIVRVSADSRYTLYVNGRRVHFGPARCYPQAQSYDILDLAQFLEPGPNAVCAIAHQFGVPTFQSVYRQAQGFLLDGQIQTDAGAVTLNTPDGWLCRASRAWRKDVARRTIQLGFQEHFDAGEEPPDWLLAAYETKDADGWHEPTVIGPAGCWPWLALEPRGVPLLADHAEDFAAVVGQFRGQNVRGYKVADDVYHLPLQEPGKPDKTLIEAPAAMLHDDDAVATIAPPGDGQFVMAVLDLGQYRTGHLMLDIADAGGDEIIDLIYTEDIEKNKSPMLLPADSHCEEATADRYRCRPGPQKWETFHFNGMRYATLVFRNIAKPLKIRHVALRQVHADVPDAGSFECSDPLLTRIWHVGRETQRNCLFDAFVDCPWREQAMWWGDARVQAKVTAAAFGDTSILERGIRLIAQSQGEDGSLHAHAPSDAPYHRLPDFMLTWVSSLADYHLYTGKHALLRQCAPVMHKLFEFFAQHEARQGLIGNFDGWWVFLDWQPLHKTNFSAVLNLMYLQALRDAAGICRFCDDEAAAARYRQKAQLLQQSIEAHFWDEKQSLWRDGFDPATEQQVPGVSQHANALAIILGLKPEHHARLAADVLLKPAQSRRTSVITGSPFFYAYILQAMIRSGLRRQAVQIIRDKWGQMLERGATTFWELWDVTRESRCHAWSASPVYHLSEQVLGVQQLDPGWSKARIAPLVGELEFARGVVPTPHGPIRVEWERVGEDQLAVRIDLPHGIDAQFVTPLGQVRQLVPGVQEFHT